MYAEIEGTPGSGRGTGGRVGSQAGALRAQRSLMVRSTKTELPLIAITEEDTKVSYYLPSLFITPFGVIIYM